MKLDTITTVRHLRSFPYSMGVLLSKPGITVNIGCIQYGPTVSIAEIPSLSRMTLEWEDASSKLTSRSTMDDCESMKRNGRGKTLNSLMKAKPESVAEGA